MPTEPSLKNKSEMLFEGYLRSHGHEEFPFEPEIPGTSKRPDYRLLWNRQEILFEVKEFRGTREDFASGGGFFNRTRRFARRSTPRAGSSRRWIVCCSLVLLPTETSR